MRKLAIAMALASTALASPALARDNSGYVGLEGGFLLVEDTDLDAVIDDDVDLVFDNGIQVNHSIGFDIDAIAGYDFGIARAEIELGYKHANIKDLHIQDPVLSGTGTTFKFDADGSGSVLSGMGNVLLDFGDDNAWSGSVGGGVGFANVKYDVDGDDLDIDFDDGDTVFAWQVIAAVRYAITANFDLGLKYRYFTTKPLRIQ